MTLIPIVDEEDNILEYRERNSLDLSHRYRVSALWMTNSQGEILLAQRHKSKKHHPLLW
jgi:isopentenyldiphosphate isomerase